MSTSIDQAFIKQFEAEVHMAFQRKGSKLRGTIRTKTGVTGNELRFQKIGTATMGTKARHGNIPVANIDHTFVDCPVEDAYVGEYVDKLDLLKTNVDERSAVQNTLVYAAGRKIDDTILAAMDTTGNSANVGTSTAYSTAASWIAFMEAMGNAEVPDDGQRYAVVSWGAWGDLLDLDEFSRAEYVGQNDLWTQGVTAKRWLGFTWMPHSGLPVGQGGGTAKKCFFYHSSAVGHIIGQEPATDITWVGEKGAWFIAESMSEGAVLIDQNGVIELNYTS